MKKLKERVKFFKKLNFFRFLTCFLCVGICIFAIFIAYPKTARGSQFPIKTPQIKTVLSLWNIDTFEGGKGSRADFLTSVALNFCDKDTIIMVTSHTVESSKNAIEKGDVPDIISYGVGVDFIVKEVKKLPKISFLGGEVGGEIYAYPWCVGGYYLITKTEDNRLIDTLFISQNEYNLPFFAMEENKIEANEVIIKSPLDAYYGFLSGNDSCALIGTQRDLVRLKNRNAKFFAKPLSKFSDIAQYISICTADKNRYEISLRFIESLISKQTQDDLQKIAMYSAFYKSEWQEEKFLIDFSKIDYTVSPFTSAKAIKSFINDFKGQKLTNNSLLLMKNALKRL